MHISEPSKEVYGIMPIEIDGNTYFRSAEVSEMTGVSKSTIHRWLKEGIIPPARFRDRNGWVLFTEEDIHRIKDEARITVVELNELIPSTETSMHS